MGIADNKTNGESSNRRKQPHTTHNGVSDMHQPHQSTADKKNTEDKNNRENKNKEQPQHNNIVTALRNRTPMMRVVCSIHRDTRVLLGECTDSNHTAAEHTRTAAILDTQPYLHAANTSTETGGDCRQQNKRRT